MRVALLNIDAGRGGVVNVVWQLARGLKERGHEPIVVCGPGSELDRLRDWGVAHETMEFSGRLGGLIRSSRRLREVLRRVQPDVVHSHSRLPSMVALAAGFRPDVSTLHSDCLTQHGSRWDFGWIRRWLSVWGRRVLTLDESARAMLVREMGISERRIHVVPNGIDPVRYTLRTQASRAAARRELGLRDDVRILLFVGRLAECKRVNLCMEACNQHANKTFPELQLLIVGGGPDRSRLESLANSMGMLNRCHFAGWRDPLAAYHAADLLLLPSSQEGFGLVCVEAMLCGVPVLRSRTGGTDQQIIEGRTGWAFDVEDSGRMLELCAAAIENPGRLWAMSEGCRAHAITHFTEQIFLDRMMAIYRQAAGERGRA